MNGQTVTHYRVADKIGEGASSVVYRADDLSLGREVVLKFVSAGSEDPARFLHEARTISSLNHPNICTIYEIGNHEGRCFLAMELLEGEVLSQTIARHSLPVDRVLDIGIQIAAALEAAHAERIVHRDLKPANIFVTRSGHVKLLDFGVALLLPARHRLVSSRQTTGKNGTIPYMSPEQAQAEDLDHRSDLFSLGVVLYEMATGRRPFSASTASETLSAIVNRAPVAPREIDPLIPAPLERVIARALEKKPELRYQTASDFKADLQRLRRDLDGVAIELPHSSAMPSAGWPRGLLAAAALGALLLGGASWWVISDARARRGSRPRPADAGATPSPPPPPAVAPVPAQASSVEPPRATPEVERSTANAAPPPPTRATSSDQLAIAKQEIDLKLYDQAIATLGTVAGADDRKRAIEASFQIAAIEELQGSAAAAMSTYVEIATRFAGDPRAAEALYRLGRTTLKSKRTDSERDALRTIDTLVTRYPGSVWAPRALLMRAEVEERQGAHQRDDVLGGSVPAAVITYRLIAQRYASSDAALPALVKLAAFYADRKQYASAVKAYEAVAARDADGRYDAWFAAGEIYDKRLKDAARAKTAYSRVPFSSPHYAQALKRR